MADSSQYRVIFDGGAKPNPGRAYGSWRSEHTGKGRIHRVEFDWLDDNVTSNQAEFLTLIEALHEVNRVLIPPEWRPRSDLVLVGDSRLVLSQIDGSYAITNPLLAHLNRAVKSLVTDYRTVTTQSVGRDWIVSLFGH